MDWMQIVVTVGGVLGALLIHTVIFGHRLGKFEGTVSTKLQQAETDRKETREAIDKNRQEAQASIAAARTEVQTEIRELRRDQNARFDKMIEAVMGRKFDG